MRVTSLSLFPVKSFGGVDVDRVAVTRLGPEGDRRWVLLDPDGTVVTARTRHALLSLTAEPTANGIRLRHDGDVIEVEAPGPGADTVPAQVSRLDRLPLADASASEWLSHRLGAQVRLAHQRDEDHRSVSASHGGLEGEPLSLADTGPLHLVTESSVDRLRDWVAETQGEEWLDRRHDSCSSLRSLRTVVPSSCSIT